MKIKILLIPIVFTLMFLVINGVFAQTMLYKTDFSPAQTSLSAPIVYNSNACWQNITAINVATGISGPITPGRFTKSGLLLAAGGPVTVSNIGNYITNEIQQVSGPEGNPVYALFQNLKINNSGPPTWGDCQDAFLIENLVASSGTSDLGDVYYTYWFKFQSDLHTQIGKNTPLAGDNWRVMSEWKSGGFNGAGGDYRIGTVVQQGNDGSLSWNFKGDNDANGGLPGQTFWSEENTFVPVPVGEWFKYEVFWHRSSGEDGRYWAAVNGLLIIDHKGPNMGINNLPVNRIFLNNVYTGGYTPAQQWTTGLEIWDGFPCGAGVSCYRPTGLTEMNNQMVYKVYPNPFNTNFNIIISAETLINNATMKIYDLCGKEVKNISIKSHETSVDRGEMKSGMYFYSIVNNKEIIENGKLVVQ